MTLAVRDSRSPTTLAFDRLAASYDALADGEIFRLLRERTHRAFARHFTASARVLEIGCGTGLDAQFLAGRCRHVVACDPSEEMVTQSLRRLAHEVQSARATVMLCGLQDVQSYLDALTPPELFDGIVSNFGALNCVSHLAPLGALVRRHLRPGGVVLLGVMSRFCAMEALYFLATRRPRLVARRMGRGAVPVPVAGVDVPTYYHRVSELRAALGPSLRLVGIEGLGVAIPPPYFEPRWRRLPGGVRTAASSCDAMLARWPGVNRLGDHMLLHFVREHSHG